MAAAGGGSGAGRAPARGGAAEIEFHPLTPGRWSDLERLFGERGACGGCWCMWARLPSAEFRAGVGAKNRRAFRRIVAAGDPPGILAYVNGEPAGWCAVGPRAAYRRLETSRVLQPVDDRPVWSVVCFFIARPFRRHGLTSRLLEEVVRFAGSRGATIVEGYPTDPRGKLADAFVWTGLAQSFERAGFREVARRSPTRPIMRRTVRGARAKLRMAPARVRARAAGARAVRTPAPRGARSLERPSARRPRGKAAARG
jgi:GNAT superfamily N-acetyltransferase